MIIGSINLASILARNFVRKFQFKLGQSHGLLGGRGMGKVDFALFSAP